MELKHLITRFVYRIEPKPEGGFIARASDPSVAPLEAPTREELQQKIQQTILAGLASEFPNLKLPADGTRTEFAFHVEHGPDGGFSIHSADGITQTGSQNDFQSRFLEKFLNFAGKHLTPELSQALAQSGNGNIKVVVNKTVFSTKGGSPEISVGASQLLPLGITVQGKNGVSALTLNTAKPDQVSIGGTIGNTAIVPEKSTFGNFFVFAVTAAVLAIVLYFILHR